MPNFTLLKSPTTGTAITRRNGQLVVPDDPIIPFIEGDGIGRDIWRASVRVLDAAVDRAYGGRRKIAWLEVFAGEKSFTQFQDWLPGDTVEAFREYYVGIKGPLTTPVGGGIRSLNVALRQLLDLYVCLRPVRWYKGVPSPVKHPEKIDIVIFRENTEDIYAGIEYSAGSPDAQKVLDFFAKEFPAEFKKVRFGTLEASRAWQAQLEGIGAPKRDVIVEVGVGLKAVSRLGTERLVHSAIGYARQARPEERDAGAQGQHHEVHRRRLPRLGLPGREGLLRRGRDRRRTVVQDSRRGKPGAGIVIKDAIADITLQQVLTRPDEFDVIATLNLNGDYLSDALAAQVGGIGIAPGGNINYVTGHAVFEATHGTAPKYADQDKVNPGSVILSGEMMLRHLGLDEAADLVVKGMEGAISTKHVTYDFARLTEGATELKTSEFADVVIKSM